MLRCTFFYEALALSTSTTVILPQRTGTQIDPADADPGRPPAVLPLLHRLSDGDSTWLRPDVLAWLPLPAPSPPESSPVAGPVGDPAR